MAHSTKRLTATKRPKNFPLTPRGDGRWCKKVRGRTVYFRGTAQEALDEWLRVKDDLLAGREPTPKDGFCLTVEEGANHFLTAKEKAVESGELHKRTFYDYFTACGRIIECFGKTRLVKHLGADDFATLRTRLTKKLGPVALGNVIQRIRTVFKFLYEQGLIEKPIRYGQSFAKPTRKVMRKNRAQQTAERGKKMFAADELRTIIDAAPVHLKAMIFLAINAGLGNTDVAELPISAIDFPNGWLNFARVKTGIERRCPLWPETVAALEAAIAARPMPKEKADEALVFITKYGKPWVRVIPRRDGKTFGTPSNAVQLEIGKLLRSLGVHRRGVGFYALRHTFATVGGESKDQIAVNAIMGHVDESMSGAYRESISDARLLAVTNHVRRWLFGEPEADEPAQPEAKPKASRGLRIVG